MSGTKREMYKIAFLDHFCKGYQEDCGRTNESVLGRNLTSEKSIVSLPVSFSFLKALSKKFFKMEHTSDGLGAAYLVSKSQFNVESIANQFDSKERKVRNCPCAPESELLVSGTKLEMYKIAFSGSLQRRVS